MKNISDMEPIERPREKLRARGAKALSDLELLSVLLGSGTKEHNVRTLASRLLGHLDLEACNGVSDCGSISGSGAFELNYEKVAQFPGIGPAKASMLSAAFEFVRRRVHPEGVRLGAPEDVLPLVSYLADRQQEHFICITLNGAREVIRTRIISIGLIDKTPVHPREVFADAISDRASGIIVAHNHPIGFVEPSEPDREVTQVLKLAGNLLGIRLLDHIIFGPGGEYYSFAMSGEL